MPIFGNLEIPRQQKKWLHFQECPGGIWEIQDLGMAGIEAAAALEGIWILLDGENQGWRSLGCGERREMNP